MTLTGGSKSDNKDEGLTVWVYSGKEIKVVLVHK